MTGRAALAALAVVIGVVAVVPPAADAAPAAPPTSHLPCGAWGSYGRVPARTFDYDCPSSISPTTVSSLVPLWAFKTAKVVTASPVVAGGLVFVGDWSATMYALDADTGLERWRFKAAEAAGVPFGPIVSTAAVAESAGRLLVVFGAGPVLHALDAATGGEVWRRYVGSAPTEAEHPDDEQTEIESSPLVAGGIVYVGLDVHNRTVDENHGVRGGVLAVDLGTGVVLGRFDPEHDFLDDATGARLSGCSSVWSSPALDVDTGTLYFGTGNCPHDLPAGSDWGRHVEAVSAIDADPATWDTPAEAVRWTYTPDPLNRDDTDFGATPNLFLDAAGRKVLGIGKKDAVYYALDPATGELRWKTQVTEPGNVGEDFAVGGFIGSPATGRGGVFGGTAIGFSPPYFHALDGASGEVHWNGVAGPSYAASAFVNGVVLAGALDNELKAWDARTGDQLWGFPLAGPISSGPAVVGDRVYVGSGTSSSDLCAKDTPGADACLAVFEEALGRTGGVHAFRVGAPGHHAAAGGTSTGSVLLSNEGNRLWAYDLATLERRVVLRSAADDPVAGRDINGQVCVDPRDRGHFIAGEDTGQPDPPPGWGYFALHGQGVDELVVEQVGKLTPSYAGKPDNFGCGFLSDGRLVTTAIGDTYPGQPANGQLLLWFPPFDRTDVPSCTLDATLATAGGIQVDGQDRVYVATNRPDDAGNAGGVFRFTGPFPTSPDECGGPVAKEQVVGGHPAVLTPSSVAASGRGTLYVSSVISGTIAEFDVDGGFVRLVLAPSGVPGRSSGTPFGLAVDGDGTLYYADLGVVGVDAEASNGTVRRIRFDAAGDPLPPETLNAGLDFPDGLGLLPAVAVSVPAPPAPTPGGEPAVVPAGGSGLPATGGSPSLALALFAAGLGVCGHVVPALTQRRGGGRRRRRSASARPTGSGS